MPFAAAAVRTPLRPEWDPYCAGSTPILVKRRFSLAFGVLLLSLATPPSAWKRNLDSALCFPFQC